MDHVVSSFVRQHRDEILRSWETAVVSEERGVALLGLALRNDVPPLLDALAEWLEGGESPERSRVTAEASRHVMQRLDLGLSLAQVFREYRILRETIIATVLQAEADEQERAGVAGDAGRIARIKGLARLNAGLDVVLSQSVVEFVAERDRRAANERIRAQDDVRGSEERYRTLFATIDQGFFVIDVLFDEHDRPIDMRYVEANAAATRIVGKDFTGKRLRELDPRHESYWYEIFGKVALTGESVRMERSAEPDGRWYSFYVFRIGGPKSRRVGNLFLDITERKHAEEALRDSEERLRADVAAFVRMQSLSGRVVEGQSIAPLLQETVDAAVAMMSADMGNMQLVEGDTLRIVAHSGYDTPFLDYFAAAEKVASTCGEATRRGERVVVPDVETSPIFTRTASLEVLRNAGVRAVQSTPLRTRSGRLLGILTTQWKEPHAPDEHDLSLLDLLVRQAADLIDVKQSQDALRESDRRKSEFLAMLSHELRNPLAPIRNSIYLLERAAPDSEPATRAREVVHRQTEHLTRLIDDLLDVTRISHGKIPLHRTRVDLREIIRKTTDDLYSVFTQAGVDLRVDTAAPMWIEADATRIAQVLTNLLNNSLKFTPNGGTVRVSAAACDGRAELSVIDDGIGMDPKQIEHMFEPFAQADHSLARTKGGLGLGLALVKSIVELHGGTVGARSEGPGRGAEFLVRLPLVTAGAESDKPRNVDTGTVPKTILVIEDNADGAQSLADILALHGHRVQVARDGRSGIALARKLRPDVILCDIGLPDVDGYDVARTLRSDGPLRDARLIALSGYAQPEDRQRARDAGFDAHIPKPPDLEELLGVLAKDKLSATEAS